MYGFSLRRRAAARRSAPYLALAICSTLAPALASCRVAMPADGPTAEGGAPWKYEVVANEGARELRVDVHFPPGTLADLDVLHGAAPFITDVESVQDGRWRAVGRDGGSAWRVPECATLGCRVRYRVKLRDAANELADVDRARRFDDVTVARPSMWMMHPTFARRGARYRVHVGTPAGTRFVTGIFPAPDGARDTYEGDASLLRSAAYTAFGSLEVHRVDFAGADILLAMQPGVVGVSEANLRAWALSSARAVGGYFGCFPVSRVLVVVVGVDGHDVERGRALGDGGAGIVVEVGRKADDAALLSDWVLTHEMVHLGFPSVDRQHHWLEEGIATYVQPIAQARAGTLGVDEAWSTLARGLPKGLPRAHDHGLDHTPTWARTYWGGALFCFVADIEIRKRTGNRHSLDDALRAIVSAGGNISVAWDIGKALDTGDRAVGVPVLRELYAKMANQPTKVSLDEYWKRLGVTVEGERVALDDDAPLASLRRAMTAPRSAMDGRNAGVARDVAACPRETSTSARLAHDLR
jgi:hypothetical protein